MSLESPRSTNGQEEKDKPGTEQHREDGVETIVTHDVSMKSLVASLAEMGFELEPDHRLSFHHPEK